MLYNFKRKKLYRHLLVGGAMCAAGLGIFSCSDTYDLDTEQPSGLNSIYGYLQDQGNYSITMRLIDDLGQTEVLSKTGSKTLFVADDAAFAAFFADNSWGVKRYDDLSYVQKKLLLNSAMIDNPFTTSMLSTAEGPVKGEVCRRASSVSIYDSVMTVPVHSALADEVLPRNSRFDEVRSNPDRDTLVLFTDNSISSPMLTFTEKFLTSNKIQSTDIDFVYNQTEGTRQTDDVYVNNAIVTEPNIFCKNGFIHKVDRVIVPLDNMAEVIRKMPQATKYHSLIDRFASPEYSASYTNSFNNVRTEEAKRLGTTFNEVDSVFVKRYFSDRTFGSTDRSSVAYDKDNHGAPMEGGAKLKFDPGWNGYLPAEPNPRDGMQEDIGVMLVPSDAAIDEWWNNGAGAVIKDFYGNIESTPSSVIDDLIRVNQLISFIQAVPSRFEDLLNDANEPLGIKTSDIDKVYLASNGLIYQTNKVFSPASYSSVLFPAVVDTANFRNIENAISNLQYNAYLNSMVAKYTLLLPTNKGLLTYIDPVSYGINDGKGGDVQLWEIGFDETKKESEAITVDVYNATLSSDGKLTKVGDKVTQLLQGTGKYNDDGSFMQSGYNEYIKNRFVDMLDNIIVTEGYQPGKKYYKTKGNTFVRIDGNKEGASVYGSFQQECNSPLPVAQTYNMVNGTSLILDGVSMGTRNSVAMLLNQHPETFSDFYQLIADANAKMTEYTIAKTDVTNVAVGDIWYAGDQTYGNLINSKAGGGKEIGEGDNKEQTEKTVGAENVAAKTRKITYLLNNYHYTLYAPTNAAMQKAYAMGLPTHDDFEAAKDWDEYFAGLTKAEREKLVAETGCCYGDSTERIQEVYLDFLKYHIQDNAIFVDEGYEPGTYYSGKTALIEATEVNEETGEITTSGYTPGRPYRIEVESISSAGITLRDNIGNTAKVITSGGLCNMMAREYWYKKGNKNSKDAYEATLDNSSFVVVHAIDNPLIYADGKHNDETQFKYKERTLKTE